MRISLSYVWKDIFQYFGITNYFNNGTLIVGVCPVHSGDNQSAFNLNIDSESEYFGNWFCNSHQCHQKFGRDMLGLLRGIMHSLDESTPFIEVVRTAESFVKGKKIDLNLIENDNVTNFLLREEKKNKNLLDRQSVRKRLDIPSPWYVKNRGFSAQILDDFDVGDCKDPTSQMAGRTVFPVYSEDGKWMIGCTGRRRDDGPNKWINSKGFNKSSYLYGYNKAIQRAKEIGSLILVEGQGDVLRMHEAGIINTVGLFGLSLSDSQEFLLQKSGVMKIILGLDNNDAGKEASIKIEERLSRFFNIDRLTIPDNDIGAMKLEDMYIIREQIKDFS